MSGCVACRDPWCVLCALLRAVHIDIREAADRLGDAIDHGAPTDEMAAESRLEELRILRKLLIQVSR